MSSTLNILSCYHLDKTLSPQIAKYHINPWLTNRSLERESQSTGFLFLDPLVSEKLPSLKGSNATYNQNRWPFDTDTFVNLSLSGFWKIPSLQSTVPLFSRCTRGMLRQDFLKSINSILLWVAGIKWSWDTRNKIIPHPEALMSIFLLRFAE